MPIHLRPRPVRVVGAAVLVLLFPGVARAAGTTQVLAATGRYTLSVDGWANAASTRGGLGITKPTASSTVYRIHASLTNLER